MIVKRVGPLSCAKIAGGIHPDVVTLAREGAAQIVPIESVRNQVIARMGLPPHEGAVFISRNKVGATLLTVVVM